MKRYDRETDNAGNLTRVHQEDFCQALDFGYDRKYESEGGPVLKDCFSILAAHSVQPIIDKRNLLRWVVFNYLIGNCDAHIKNISLFITEEGFRLAPFYDLMSTVVYPALSKKLAMKIGGEARPEWILKRHWERLAQQADVGLKAVAGICGELGETLPESASKLAKDFTGQYGAADVIWRICGRIASAGQKLLFVLGA